MDTIYINQLHKTKFKISSNDEQLIKYLRTKYSAQAIPIPGYDYKCIVVEQNCGSTNLLYDNKKYITQNPLVDICNLMYAEKEFDVNIFAVHGAAVEYNKQAYIFLAQTYAGKSTLTAFLALNGLSYITDDCVLINNKTLKIVPDFTPISLREGGRQVLSDIGYPTHEFDVLEYPPLTEYAYTPQKITGKPIGIGGIFFIKRSDQNSLASMSCSERMLLLLKSPITNYTLNEEYIQFIKELSSFPCYKLCYSDMEYVLEIITNGK